jgi:hypothetical protein
MDAGQGFRDLPAFEMLKGNLEVEQLRAQAQVCS